MKHLTTQQIYSWRVKRESDIAKALEKLQPSLQKKPNFIGYGVGHKKKSRKILPGLCAVLLVKRKIPLKKLKKNDRLPSWIYVGKERIVTDVIVFKRPKPTGNPSKNRAPRAENEHYKMGASIGTNQKDSNDVVEARGSAGALVHDTNGQHFLLSAGHVLVIDGLDVIQPGSEDGGKDRDPPPNPTPPNWPQKNNVGNVTRIASGGIDAGLAEINTKAEKEVIDLGVPTGAWSPIVDLPVQKSGAGSGVTQGKILRTHEKIVGADNLGEFWQFPNIFTGVPPTKNMPTDDNAAINDLFHISDSFGVKGDSGALVMAGPLNSLEKLADDILKDPKANPALRDTLKDPNMKKRLAKDSENKAVGLLIGNHSNNNKVEYTIGQDIKVILSELKVTLD